MKFVILVGSVIIQSKITFKAYGILSGEIINQFLQQQDSSNLVNPNNNQAEFYYSFFVVLGYLLIWIGMILVLVILVIVIVNVFFEGVYTLMVCGVMVNY